MYYVAKSVCDCERICATSSRKATGASRKATGASQPSSSTHRHRCFKKHSNFCHQSAVCTFCCHIVHTPETNDPLPRNFFRSSPAYVDRISTPQKLKSNTSCFQLCTPHKQTRTHTHTHTHTRTPSCRRSDSKPLNSC